MYNFIERYHWLLFSFVMATGMSTIFLRGLGSKTRTCHFPTKTFHRTTISELKRAVQNKTEIGLDQIRLVYGCKQLETIRMGEETTFSLYNIQDKSTIELVVRLPGGPQGFVGLNFKKRNLYTEGPEWCTIPSGMSFRGTCKNFLCQARNQSVNIQKGFYDSTGGKCMLNYEITQLKCPVCEETLGLNEVNEIGVFNAKLEIKSKVKGSSEVVVNIEARDEYLRASCKDEVDCEYFILIVKRL